MQGVPGRGAKRKQSARARGVEGRRVVRRFYSVAMQFMRKADPPLLFKFRNILAGSAGRAIVLALRQARQRSGFGSHATYDYHDIDIQVREVGEVS